MPLDLEPRLDRLYGAELLDEFVAERKELVRALRKDGRRAEAARVQELRKPSLPAWTVNQLVRRSRKPVGLLLEGGERLAAAQHALLGGGEQKAFAEARKREQALLTPLRDAARQILGQRGSEDTIDRVTSTLRAAIVTAEGRAQLAQGRLTSEIEPRGFEVFAGAAPAKTSKPRERRPDDANTKPRQEAKTRARAGLKAARERQAVLSKQLRDADRAVREARQALDAAERQVERLRSDRDAAAEAIESSRRELEAAGDP